jgi:hypothetical protein
MEKRHDDLLTARIEEVAANGWAFIQWWEAYLWTGQKKLGKNFWRDLEARFATAYAKRSPPDLQFCQTPAGLLLINPDGLAPISSKSSGNGGE